MLNRQGLSTVQKRRKEIRCGEIDLLTGSRCNAIFTRPWNLKRHQRDLHGYPITEQSDEVAFSAPEIQLRKNPTRNPAIPIAPMQETAAPRTKSTPWSPGPTMPFAVVVPSKNLAQPAHSDFLEHSSSEESEDTADWRTPSENDRTYRFEQEMESDEATSGLGTPTDSSNQTGRKRKRSDVRGRTTDARFKDEVPMYPVKRSKKYPNQQRGLGWLSGPGKEHFDSTHASILAQWGVKADHWGTCVLLPEDWKALDPVDLMAMFQDYDPPGNKSSRAWYAYSDHATTLARAAAWYRGWPRSGAQMDNFLGCGDYKPKDGSHLCHHEHCIIHLEYEAADINADRWNCCLEARFLRQDNREVPEECTKHKPPCLMQVSHSLTRTAGRSLLKSPKHAALTNRETYYIQFAVLRQAKGMPPALPIPRPRRYLYSTMESQLPCSFPAVSIGPDDLIDDVPPAKKEGRPDLVCAFCSHIKTYASIAGYWGHLVNKHKQTSEELRLQEVLRTATLWRTYWEEHSDGGKIANSTMVRLLQIEQEGFGWQQVVGWNLR